MDMLTWYDHIKKPKKNTDFFMILAWLCRFNPLTAKINYLNFHPLEVVSRYRDPQLQVGGNYLYLLNLWPNICKSWCSNNVPNKDLNG